MAVLTTAARKALPKTAFVVPGQRPGAGSYPIPDAAHARNALARSSGKPVAAAVRVKVKKKFPGIGLAKGMKTGGLVKGEESARHEKTESTQMERREDRGKKMRQGGFIPFKKKGAMPMDQAGEMAARMARAAAFEQANGTKAF